MTITNRESVLYALHRLTGRPVRFNSPLTEATKQGWAQLVEVNGRSMAELKKIATATEPQNASEAAEVYGEMVRWCAADPHARTIESLLPLIGPLLSRVVRAPASDVSGEELMTFYQCIETATGGLERLSINHRHLLTQLLEAAEDPVWHQRLLRSMLCQSRPVLVAGNHYDKSEAGSFDDPVFLEGWQTKPVFNAKIPRGGGGQKKRSMALDADLEHVLQRLMTESDVAASEAVEPLLDYVSLAVPSTAARAFLVRLLDSDRAEYRNRAASLLMYRWRDDTTIRDRVFKVMLDTVLESDSDAEAINAWKTLVGGPRSGLKPWNYRQEELHRILDFIETHHGQPEPMFRPGRQVASDMPLSSSPGDSAPPSVYPVSRRILALTLLLRIDRTPHAPDVSLPRLLKLLPAAPPAVETPFATPLSRRKTSPLRTVFQMAHEKEIDRLQQTSPAAIESDEDVYNDILTDIVQILKR